MNPLPPLKLIPNRVWRLYTGGALLDRFQGKAEEKDDVFPEEWVGSTTDAVNEGRDIPHEGLSFCRLGDQKVLLRTLLEEQPEAMLGTRHAERLGSSAGYLVKLLDSAIRLPIQAHPDRAFSEKHLDSSYGKTESWIILDTRTIDGVKPYVLFGFRPGVTREHFADCYHRQDVEGMIACHNRVEVKAGDIFIIPGGVPHAIGSGVFLVEVQEPTDFVFQLDKKGPCWDLSPFQVHMDLGDELMFDGFHFGDQDVLGEWHHHLDFNQMACGTHELLPAGIRTFFNAVLVKTDTSLVRPIANMIIGICTRGAGTVRSDTGEISISQGETFCLPASLGKCEYIPTGGTLEVIETYPPA
ncbi:class I mannose-6-phosphate isomerase [Planctomycetota bacterium]